MIMNGQMRFRRLFLSLLLSGIPGGCGAGGGSGRGHRAADED